MKLKSATAIIFSFVIVLALAFAACSNRDNPRVVASEAAPSALIEDIAIHEQAIIDAQTGTAKLERHGELEVEGFECYTYSLYIEMEQGDGTQINQEFRRVSEYAITKSGDKVFVSPDGEEWELWNGTAELTSSSSTSYSLTSGQVGQKCHRQEM